ITLIEFKLTTLAGFVLIPFGLFGKTAFAAERVLGNVISSGIKVLVLAVIVGIGSTLFAQFTAGFGGNQPTIDQAMALVLGALYRMLGYKGPAQPSPTLGDALNAGYFYLEVRCLGCDTHQTVALDVVRRPKATPVHELERLSGTCDA